MPTAGKPYVYLLLGAAGSDRRALLADVIEGGLVAEDRPVVLLSADESPAPVDAKLPHPARWSMTDDGMISAPSVPGATHVFFVTDGRRDPIDQIQAFQAWLLTSGTELARVICVVNCQLAEKNPTLRSWYDACIHFSDIVLLTRRESVANKWMSDFLAHFQKQYFPSLFEQVKGGRVKNPQLVLHPEARRMSHAFDEEQDWTVVGADGEEIDEEEASDEEGEIQAEPAQDPYFERDAAGRRTKRIPDIRKYLEKA